MLPKIASPAPVARLLWMQVRASTVAVSTVLGLACAQKPQEPAPPPQPPPPVASDPTPDAAPAPVALPVPTAPVLVDAAVEAHGAAQARLLDGRRFPLSYRDAPRRRTRAGAYAGVSDEDSAGSSPDDTTRGGGARPVDAFSLGRFVAVGGAGPDGLERFYLALARLEERRTGPGSGEAEGPGETEDVRPEDPLKVRIAFYGSSQTAADYLTSYVRVYLQRRFGDGGHGFIALARPWGGYRHLDWAVDTTGDWHTDHAQKKDRRLDGLYGLLGASTSTSRRRSRTTVRPRNGASGSRFELHYLMQPAGGSFDLWVDGQRDERIDTAAPDPATGYHALTRPPGRHTFEVRPRGDGHVRLFGMTIENESDGVVVDTLGVNGARAANHLTWDEAAWMDALRRREPALYVLAYGANESIDEDQPVEDYARELGEVLDRFRRAVPAASCLLFGPGDFPKEREDGSRGRRPRLQRIIEIQRTAARETGCAFWDTQAFMGGPMGIADWVAAEPTMARPDHLHLTKLGYARMGQALVDSIMAAYDAPPGESERKSLPRSRHETQVEVSGQARSDGF